MDGDVKQEAVVSRWFAAFNSRDLEAILGCMSDDAGFQPVGPRGTKGEYSGHDGARRWFADSLETLGHETQIELTEVSPLADGRVLAVGSLRVGQRAASAPFCGVHVVADGKIVDLRHYFTDAHTMRRLGYIP